LKTTAEDKVKAIEAELTKAKQSNDNTATDTSVKKLEQARKDMNNVFDSEKKVQDRHDVDKQKLSVKSGDKVAQKAISSFAKKLKAKFENLQVSAMQASKHDVTAERESWQQEAASNVNATKALEGRITNLEDAVATLGGDATQIEAGGNATQIEAGDNPTQMLQQIGTKGVEWEKTMKNITTQKHQLQGVEAKINALDTVISAAKAKNDIDAEMKAGTQQKDLEHEAKNIRTKLDSMYDTANPPVDVTAVIEVSQLKSTSVQVKDLTEEQNKFKNAMQEAKVAGHKRVAVQEKQARVHEEVKKAVKHENDKISDAQKAKESLSQKMVDLTKQEQKERTVVQAAKTKFTQEASDLKQQEMLASQKQQEMESKLRSANLILQTKVEKPSLK